MMNKRFTKFGSWVLVFVLACATPVIPLYPSAGKNKTGKKDKSFDDYWNSFKKSVRKMYRKAKKEYRNHDDVVPYVLGVAALLVGGLLLYKKIIPSWFTCSPSLTDDVLVGKAQCKGYEKKHSDNVVIKQVLVKDQFDYDGGGSASCGYHVLKNLILLSKGIMSGQDDIYKELHNAQLIQRLFGPSGEWRQLAKDHNKRILDTTYKNSKGVESVGTGDWLTSEYLDAIIRNESTVNGELLPGNARCNIVVIDDINLIGLVGDKHQDPVDDTDADQVRDPYEGVACPVTVHVGQGLAENAGRDYIVGFCIQTAQQSVDKYNLPKGGQGHWFGLLFYRKADGGREYIVVDSTNGLQIKNKFIKRIIGVIENLCK